VGAAWDAVALQQVAKLSAFGELFTNLRADDFRPILRGEFVLAGVIVFSVLATGFYTRLRGLTAIDIYIAAVAATKTLNPREPRT
jgi:hypothetical protein